MDFTFEQLEDLQYKLTRNLKENILQYWINNTIDNEHGGFIGHIHGDNTKELNAGKGIILNSRILYSFSKVYGHLCDDKYLELAKRSYAYIFQYFKDNRHNGVYWEVDYLGNPINKKKQVYAQAFTIYALSEYYKITKDKEALKWAIELFELIENHSRDKELGGYIEAFSEEWEELDDLRLSEKDANEKKTMNTHLHILEAYSNLMRVWESEKLILVQKELIHLFLDKFITEDGHLELFFSEDWVSKSNQISFGHDIEAAWLLVEAAEMVEETELIQRTQDVAVLIAEELIKEGLDGDGSIFNEKNRLTNHFDTDKHWWQQAEGMVGFMTAFEITENSKYLTSIVDLWEFISSYILDDINGEWFWKVDINGNIYPDDEKVGIWKCPYHNTRACIEMIERITIVLNR